MLIGIDARFALNNRRGIGNYTLSLILKLLEIDDANEYVLYVNKEDMQCILPNNSNCRVSRLAPCNYAVWEQISLPRQARKDGIDILHCTGNTAPILLNEKIKLVTTIHDVMYLKDDKTLPKSSSLYQRMGRIYRNIIVPKTIFRADGIITISEFSKQDIKHVFPALEDNNIKVIYESSDSHFKLLPQNDIEKIKSQLGIKGDYILSLGAIDPRKNTELILRSFIELKQEYKIAEKLVIVGVADYKKTNFYKLISPSEVKDDIIFTSFVKEDDLVLLYNGAKIFLYPSLYEGFGLPPLEAMSCGVPVITSNTTSIPEIVEDAALLINPYNKDELKRMTYKMLIDVNMRKDFAARGLLQAKKFSWTKLAEQTLQVYESLMRERKLS